jgi:LEA14-like dessication related protein
VLVFLLLQWNQYRNGPNPDRSFLKPHLEIDRIEITKLDELRTDGSMRIKIKNPLPIAFTVSDLKCSLYLEGEDLLDKAYPEPISVNAHDSTFFEFPVSLQNQKLVGIRRQVKQEQKDSIEFELRTSFSTNRPFTKHISVNIKKKKPIFKIPEAELERTEIDSLSIRGATLIMHIHLKNLNAYPIDLEKMKYQVEIGKNMHLDGKKEGILDIPAQGQTNLELPFHMQFGNAGKAFLEVLIHGKNLDYHLEQQFIINSKNKILNNCKVHIIKDGKVGALIQLRKKQKQKRERSDSE